MLLKSYCILVISLIKCPTPCIFEKLGCECLFSKPRRYTFINISAFYELLGYCHRRPFLLHGIFIGVGTQGHLFSAPASPLTYLSRSPGTSWSANLQGFLSVLSDTGNHPLLKLTLVSILMPVWTRSYKLSLCELLMSQRWVRHGLHPET